MIHLDTIHRMAIPLWAGLIIALGMACIVFAIDVLLFRQGLFR